MSRLPIVLCAVSLLALLAPTPGTGAAPTTETQSYSNAAVCGVNFDCTNFTVPAGAASARVEILDSTSPHAGGEWCLDSCSGTIGLFCDSTLVAIPAGTQSLLVVPDAAGFGGVSSCATSLEAGEAVSGTVRVTFDPDLPVAPGATAGNSSFATYAAPTSLGASGGEPSIGVDRATGAAFVQAYTTTIRARFDDSVAPATVAWSDVSSPITSVVNLDPILATDAATGRTWAGGDNGPCSILAYTDDDGASWSPVADACTPPAVDHPTIGAGPWHGPAPVGALSSRAVYYCAQDQVDECQTSLDGGVTFLPGVVMNPTLGCAGLFGHVKVAADGTVVVPVKTCPVLASNPKYGLYVSQDNGLTWSTRVIGESSGSSGRFDASVATTPSSWIYAAWTHGDNRMMAALSKDAGQSWTAATDLGAPFGVLSSAFPAVVAGDDSRASVAFLGTSDPGNAFAAGFQGTWYLYVSTTTDGGASWTTVRASPDPVQRGWICASGTTCTTGRNLLDFIDATVDAQGRVLVAFADGCVGACADPSGTAAQSTGDLATIARQTCGPSLYAALGNVEGGGACPTGATTTSPPAMHQTATYANAPVCGVNFNCAAFSVPLGATLAHVRVRDAASPHAGAEWCADSCSGTIGSFCDETTVNVAGVGTLYVVPDSAGFTGVFECAVPPASGAPLGEATNGEITVDFT